RLDPSAGRNVDETAGQTKVFEKRPKILIPRATVEGKTPEVVEQNRRCDHVKYEQQRRLTTIKTKQDAQRADDLEGATEHQQQRRCRRGQRYPAMRGLIHRRLVVEYLIERTERE